MELYFLGYKMFVKQYSNHFIFDKIQTHNIQEREREKYHYNKRWEVANIYFT